jgi:hypothetical protein
MSTAHRTVTIFVFFAVDIIFYSFLRQTSSSIRIIRHSTLKLPMQSCRLVKRKSILCSCNRKKIIAHPKISKQTCTQEGEKFLSWMRFIGDKSIVFASCCRLWINSFFSYFLCHWKRSNIDIEHTLCVAMSQLQIYLIYFQNAKNRLFMRMIEAHLGGKKWPIFKGCLVYLQWIINQIARINFFRNIFYVCFAYCINEFVKLAYTQRKWNWIDLLLFSFVFTSAIEELQIYFFIISVVTHKFT